MVTLRFCLLSCLMLLAGFLQATIASDRLTNPANSIPISPTDPFPHVAKSYLLQVDGKTLWAHEPDLRLPPASLTKIMTALIVLERTSLDEVITIGKEVVSESGSRIGLKQGDQIQVGELLAAMLISSANDACRALAEHAGGSQRRFTVMMNSRARDMGLRDTNFTNACGHDGKGLYSTAGDLAIITEAALRNRVFRELVTVVKDEIRTVDGKRIFPLENKNELIGRYHLATGVKTGYTSKAGKCLIALAENNGTKILLVLLNAPDRWWDAVSMLDKAFATRQDQSVIKPTAIIDSLD